jgi:anti-anti-sigma factor
MAGEGGLSIEPSERVGAFVLRGEIDLHTAAAVADIPVIATGRDTELVLDAADVTFIDSIGIWALVNLSRRLEGGKLVIANASKTVRRTFDLVDLSDATGIVVER